MQSEHADITGIALYNYLPICIELIPVLAGKIKIIYIRVHFSEFKPTVIPAFINEKRSGIPPVIPSVDFSVGIVHLRIYIR